MTGNQLLTTGQIAAHTGWDRTTVHRKLVELGITPEMTAGRTRLFAPSVVDIIGNRTNEEQS
jgi:hypothetical protein